ncbi:MAG: hypothetical protein AAGF95_09010 [Chloroflexota bacterium]
MGESVRGQATHLRCAGAFSTFSGISTSLSLGASVFHPATAAPLTSSGSALSLSRPPPAAVGPARPGRCRPAQ